MSGRSILGWLYSACGSIFRGIGTWSNTITAIVTVLSLIYVVYSTGKNMDQAAKTIELSYEQIVLHRKSFPSQFEMTYRNVGDFREQAYITNTGSTKLHRVSAQYVYYFLNAEGKIVSSDTLGQYIEESQEGEKLLIEAGLISKSADLKGLLGTHRTFDIAHLEPNKETLVEISSSSNLNAIRIGDVLGFRTFTRWKIKYNEELTNKKVVRRIYVWMHNEKSGQANRRVNLDDIVGGTRVIGLIEKYESDALDAIFGIRKNVHNKSSNADAANSAGS